MIVHRLSIYTRNVPSSTEGRNILLLDVILPLKRLFNESKTNKPFDDSKYFRLLALSSQVKPTFEHFIKSHSFSKHAAEIPYSFTVELPDTGSSGFLLPPSQIKTVGAELWAATSVVSDQQ